MRKIAVQLAALALTAAPAFAEGLHHATSFEMRRDGAWIVNFALLLAGLLWIIFRFVVPALKQRSEVLQRQMDESEKGRADARLRLADLEKKIKDFEAEASRIRQEAASEGEKTKQKIIAEAQAAAKRILEKSRTEIESETAKARARLKKEAVEMAVEMAADMLKRNVAEGDHRAMVKQYIEGVGGRK